jgi:putative GTP pyrophosphokinase
LILEVPIYLTSGKYMMKVELQLRTIAMDFWASIDHKMKYKRDIPNEQSVTEELLYVADMINQLDRRMIQLRDRIDKTS